MTRIDKENSSIGRSPRRTFIKAASAGALSTAIAGCGSSDDTTDTSTLGTGDSSDTTSDGEFVPVEFKLRTFPKSSLQLIHQGGRIVFRQWEEKLGVNIEFTPTPIPEAVDRLVNGDYTVFTNGWGAGPERLDPSSYLSDFHSETGGISPKYNNSEYDEVVEKVQTTPDQNERQKFVYQCQEILADDQPVIFLYHDDDLAIRNDSNFSGWTEVPGGHVYGHQFNVRNVRPKGDRTHLVYAVEQYPPTLNPFAISTNVADFASSFIYSRLFRIGPDKKPHAWAAESFEFSDATTVDVTVRDNITFHDGEQLTPEDVKFTVEAYQEFDVPSQSAVYSPIESVKLKQGNIARFNLTKPLASFISVNLTQLNILPQHIWEGATDEHGLEHPKEWQNPDLTGSAPLKIEQVEQEDKIIYSRHDGHPADVAIDRFIWQNYGGTSAAYGDVAKGVADYMERTIQPTQFDRAKQDSNLSAVAAPSHGFQTIYLNPNRPPFDDSEVRRAFAHATNKQEVIDVVYGGRGDIAKSPIAPVNEYWYNPDAPDYTGGKSKARSILKNKGFKLENGQLMMPKSIAE